MYNLLVTGDENAWETSFYEFPLERFGEYTESTIREKFKVLDSRIIEELKSFPALFVYEGNTKNIKVGYIRRIKKRIKTIYIEYEFESEISEIPFSKINDLKIQLDIQETGRGIGEFERTHWALKDENLFEILFNAGLIDQSLLNPTENLDNGQNLESKVVSDVVSNLSIIANTDPDITSKKECALIMKGGGIKGLAYVGAIDVLQRQYEFNWFIGTSAGAIVAILLGAGYNTEELKEILQNKNFKDFFDAKWYQQPRNLVFYRGLHPAETFTFWLDELLAKKLKSHTRVKMSELPNRVTIYASRRGMSVLKFDSKDNDADAAYAARCSMSIPWIFTPQSDQGFRAYDGGIQNNYPLNKLLEEYPGTQFISLYLGSEIYEPIKQKSVLLDMVSIATESSEPELLKKYRDRTIIIDPRPIRTLDFSLSSDEKDFLLLAGQTAALAHHDDTNNNYNKKKKQRDEIRSRIENTRKARKKRQFWMRLFIFAICTATIVCGAWWLVQVQTTTIPDGKDITSDEISLSTSTVRSKGLSIVVDKTNSTSREELPQFVDDLKNALIVTSNFNFVNVFNIDGNGKVNRQRFDFPNKPVNKFNEAEAKASADKEVCFNRLPCINYEVEKARQQAELIYQGENTSYNEELNNIIQKVGDAILKGPSKSSFCSDIQEQAELVAQSSSEIVIWLTDGQHTCKTLFTGVDFKDNAVLIGILPSNNKMAGSSGKRFAELTTKFSKAQVRSIYSFNKLMIIDFMTR